jgi:WD40 repeat protein
MASASTKVAKTKSILAPSMTLKGHGNVINSISYFPDGQRMISGSYDKTARQWDLKEGKEIEEVRDVCEEVLAVAVSSDSRWVVSGGGVVNSAELKVCEVETRTVRKLQGHLRRISCIRDVQSWAPTPTAYAHDPPRPSTTARFVLERMYYIINDNWQHFITHRGYRYLGQVYMLYKMRRKYLKFKLT